MRHFTKMLIFVLMSVVSSITCYSGWVKGYYRKDGTYVRSHYRNTGRGSSVSSALSYGTTSSLIDLPVRNSGYIRSSDYVPMASLQQCQALENNGRQCKRKANPGQKYCYLHVNYQPPVEKKLTKDEILAASQKQIETLSRIDTVKQALRTYRSAHKEFPAALTSVSNDQCRIDDAWVHPLAYEFEKDDFAIASDGADGVAGTSDDIMFTTIPGEMYCQAFLPDGSLCPNKTIKSEWYCHLHGGSKPTAKKASPPKNRRDKGDDDPPRGGGVIVGVAALVAAGVVAGGLKMRSGSIRLRHSKRRM